MISERYLELESNIYVYGSIAFELGKATVLGLACQNTMITYMKTNEPKEKKTTTTTTKTQKNEFKP